MKSLTGLYVCVCACAAAVAHADDGTLTLEGALERARTRATAAAAGRLRVEEARGRVRAARALPDPPELEVARGHRSDGPADLELIIRQPLDRARRGRITAAEAALEGTVAAVGDDLRLALRAVAFAYHRGLAEGERLQLAREAEAQASEVLRVAERRHAAGDVADLDANLAKAAHARSRADALAAEARLALALGELRVLLAYGEDEPLRLSPDPAPSPVEPLDALLESAAVRPDVVAIGAEVREAEADATAARALRAPAVTPTFRYERDAGTTVLWGGLTIGLPVANRGAGDRAAAEARASRHRLRAEAARRAARSEVVSAHRAYALRLEGLAVLEATADLQGDSETLARRSYEEGQIGLAELLLVRRETFESRQALVDHRLEAALAAVELSSLAGRLR